MSVVDPHPPDANQPETDTAPGEWGSGARIGRFQIVRRLGGGGRATVHLATDLESGREVVLKRARPGPEPAARLRREAEILTRLSHPAVPSLLELHEDDPPFLVRDHINGLDLERLLAGRQDPIPGTNLAALLAALADAVETAHRQGCLLGDLTPANIVIAPDGSPFLVDLGGAIGLDETESLPLEIDLTPGYAAPEWYIVDAAPGPAADIYALGAVAYRAVAGEPPVTAEARLAGRPMAAAVEAGSPAYPFALRAAIDWALELDPTARPQSAGAWAETLRTATGSEAVDPERATLCIRRRPRPEPAARPAPQPAQPARRFRRSHALALGLLAVALPATAWPGYGYYQRHIKREWVVGTDGADTATIAAALERARDGATIYVQPGTYTESVTVTRPVKLVGLAVEGKRPVIRPATGPCLRITAPANISRLVLAGASRGEAGPCLEVAGTKAVVESLAVSAPSGPAVVLRDGAEVRLVDTVVDGSQTVGILAMSGARASLSGGAVRDTGLSGIVVRGGAELALDGTSVAGTDEAGVLVTEGARARLTGATLSRSSHSGVEITGAAQAVIGDSLIDASAEAGVYVMDGGQAVLENTAVRNSGYSGIVAGPMGRFEARSSRIESNGEHGVLVLGHAAAAVTDSHVSDNKGFGFVRLDGAELEAERNSLENNRDSPSYGLDP